MKRLLWISASLIIAGYLLSTCIIAVQATQNAVIMQFGKPVRTIQQAGLALKLPAPIQTVTLLDRRLQLLNMEPVEFVTRDRRNLVVTGFAAWQISDPATFLASVRDIATAQIRLRDLLNAAMGAEIGTVPVTDIFSTESQGMKQLFQRITDNSRTKAKQAFGIEIIAVRPQRFGFPQANLKTIYQRMISEQERIAKQYRAEGKEAAAKISAETEREVRELLAQSYRESQVIKGKGEAEAASIYAQAFAKDTDYYRFSRTLDAYQHIIGDNTTLILSTESPIFRYLMNPPQSLATP